MTKIYHYTNHKGLEGIVINKKIRIANVKAMNDKNEMKEYISQIEKLCLNNSENKKQIEEIFTSVWEKFDNSTLYAMSFTSNKDDASQWERYAEAGSGICIEFDKVNLTKCIENAVALNEVYYEPVSADNNAHVNGIIKVASETPVTKKDLDNLIFNLIASSGCYKHKSFKFENEYRLLSIQEMNEYFEDFPKKISYEVSDCNIREFYEIDLEELCGKKEIDFDELITGIVIGPKSKVSVKILKGYLTEKNLKKISDNVSSSECPLQ